MLTTIDVCFEVKLASFNLVICFEFANLNTSQKFPASYTIYSLTSIMVGEEYISDGCCISTEMWSVSGAMLSPMGVVSVAG
jgi:hypothetical protein